MAIHISVFSIQFEYLHVIQCTNHMDYKCFIIPFGHYVCGHCELLEFRLQEESLRRKKFIQIFRVSKMSL